jgi:hypothetical protein
VRILEIKFIYYEAAESMGKYIIPTKIALLTTTTAVPLQRRLARIVIATRNPMTSDIIINKYPTPANKQIAHPITIQNRTHRITESRPIMVETMNENTQASGPGWWRLASSNHVQKQLLMHVSFVVYWEQLHHATDMRKHMMIIFIFYLFISFSRSFKVS